MKRICLSLMFVVACSDKDDATTAPPITDTTAADAVGGEDSSTPPDTATEDTATEDTAVQDTPDTHIDPVCPIMEPPGAPEGPSFKNPQAIAVWHDTLYVANRNSDAVDFTAGQAWLTALDKATLKVAGRLGTTNPDPSSLTVRGDTLVVVNRGKVVFDKDWVAEGAGPGSIDLVKLADGTLGDVRSSISIPWTPDKKYDAAPLGIAIVPGTEVAYVGSGTSCRILKVNLDSCQLIKGPAEAIVLHDGTGNHMCRPFVGPEGKVFVTSFNTDQVFTIDTATDAVVGTPYDTKSGDFGGTSSLVYDAKGNMLYYLAEVAATIGRIDLATGKVDPAWAKTGLYPLGLYFNGDASLGTINNGDGTVQRIDTDGASSIFVTLPKDSGPSDLAYQGADLWVVLGGYGGVAKIDIPSQAITAIEPPLQ